MNSAAALARSVRATLFVRIENTLAEIGIRHRLVVALNTTESHSNRSLILTTEAEPNAGRKIPGGEPGSVAWVLAAGAGGLGFLVFLIMSWMIGGAADRVRALIEQAG